MADGDAYVGGEAKFYYNSGTYGSPTWVLIPNSQDLDAPDSRTQVPAPTRGAWPFIGHLPGSRTMGLAWSSLKKKGTSDAVSTAIKAAYDAGTPMEFAVCDGPIATTGTKGKRMIGIVTKADDGLPLDGSTITNFEVTLAVNNGGNNPTSFTT